ncbi:MAG: hypothetical protein ACOYYS_08105 [Chloroflexota bacterium]
MTTTAIEQELEKAYAARTKGNEGMARVCARRAAGVAARIFLQQQGIPVTSASAYDHLRTLSKTDGLPAPVQRAVAHLLARVDENFQLPAGVDLLEEAKTLVKMLENLAFKPGHAQQPSPSGDKSPG